MWLLEDEYCQFLPTAAFLGCKKSLWSDKKLTQYKLSIITVARVPHSPLLMVNLVLRLQRWFIRGSGLTKPSCTGRPKTPHCRWYFRQACCGGHSSKCSWTWSIAQVLSFCLPDGAKGFTAVYGQAISLSWYPSPLFIQPLRLDPNQPALRPIALPATSIDILPQLPNCKVLWHFLFGSFRYRIVCYS